MKKSSFKHYCLLVMCWVSLYAGPRVAAEDTIKIRSIGDILLHDAVYYAGLQSDGTYNFDEMLAPVKKYIENADITTANMETIVAGSQLGVSTYPQFNAPEEIVDTLKRVGVDIVNNTSNHTMDRYAEGAIYSIQNLKNKDMMYVGSYASWDDYNQLRIIEKNGIKVGFLAYSYGTNGMPIPEDQAYLAAQIDETLMPLEVKHLNQFVDLSIVMLHVGEEYESYPTDYQQGLHQSLIDAGASYILGGHPHVLEPFKIYNDNQLSLFSHGNFLSGQVDTQTKIGSISEVTYTKNDKGELKLKKVRIMPTYNLSPAEVGYYAVIPLADLGQYGFANAADLFAGVEQVMTAYSDQVEVVEYLD